MVDIVTRAGKGSPLTNAEIDQTLLNLKTAVEAAALTALWESITSKPTTLSGYGITDALPLSGGVLSGGLTVTGNLLLAANSGSNRTIGFNSGTNTTLVLQAGGATGSGANLELSADKFAYLDADESRLRSNDGLTTFLSAKSTGVNILTGALTQQGNQVLHATNYNTYAPTLTGTGASGSWGISVTGNAATVTNGVYTTGNQTIGGVKTFSDKPQSAGLSGSWGVTSTTQTGAFNATMGTAAGATWLLSGTSGGVFRAGIQALDSDGTLRFYQGANAFIFSGGTLTATTFSGALSGNASTATALQTARSINGVSFNGSANITLDRIVDAGGAYLALSSANELEYYNSSGVIQPLYLQYSGDNSSLRGPGGAIVLHSSNFSVYASPLAGSSSITTLGTIATGTWNATNIALGKGGTNAALTAVNGGVVYSGASALAITAAGTAGQALLSAGAAAPVWTTLTLENLPDAWIKRAVVAATTANITLSAPQTIDGIAVVAGNRVLVKNQTALAENGIYVVNAAAWTRATDSDTASKVAGGQVAVDQGTVNGGTTWDNDFKSTDTINTTAMSWNLMVDSGRLVIAGATTSPAAVAYNGTTAAAGQFDGGTTAPTGTARLNFGGYFYPTYLNLLGSADTATAATHYFVEQASDGFVRPKTLANVQAEIVTNAVLLARNGAGAFGYTTGAGGVVTQLTSRTTAVALNEYCGTITLFSTTTAANTPTTFTFTNTLIAAGDRLILNHVSGGVLGAYTFGCATAAGSCTISVYTAVAQATAAAPVIGFVVVKAVTA